MYPIALVSALTEQRRELLDQELLLQDQRQTLQEFQEIHPALVLVPDPLDLPPAPVLLRPDWEVAEVVLAAVAAVRVVVAQEKEAIAVLLPIPPLDANHPH